ncbi:MAG: hypothetical protein A2293_10415 [Elusimicrobia bacterium RIFOXYB2_FULL_49_7]|nr:MAG: hypothetical protein A2293_10415 [Elusimicrobia bacterium RIFOXYB2_FULL_49_7]
MVKTVRSLTSFLILSLAILSPASDKGLDQPDTLLAHLSLREKIGQTFFVYHSPETFLKQNHIGGVLIMQNMIDSAGSIRKELAGIQKRAKIPLFVGIDQEGGKINRLANLHRFAKTPSGFQLASFSPERITRYARITTDTLNALAINMNLAPCVDPAFNFLGDSTFMFGRQRALGSTPDRITMRAEAFLSGIQQAHGLCILKHFPGYDTPHNSDLEPTLSDATEHHLEQYLTPFRALIPGTSGVMMNNIIYRKIDTLPAVLSPKLVQLARALSSEKIIMTDDLWAVSLRTYIHPKHLIKKEYPDSLFKKIVKLAFLAGNDVFLITFPQKVALMFEAIQEEIARDPSLETQLNASIMRILKLKRSYFMSL